MTNAFGWEGLIGTAKRVLRRLVCCCEQNTDGNTEIFDASLIANNREGGLPYHDAATIPSRPLEGTHPEGGGRKANMWQGLPAHHHCLIAFDDW